MSLITRPMRLALDADTTAAAAIADGVFTKDALITAASFLGTNLQNIIKLGMLDGSRLRGLDIIPLLSGGSDGDTVSLKIHRVSPVMDRGNNAVVRAYLIEHLYTLTLTASTLEYTAGTIGEDSTVYRAIDEIVLAATSDRATHIEAVTGAAIAIDSNTANTQGAVSLPDLGGAFGIILEPTCSAGAFNALIEPKT